MFNQFYSQLEQKSKSAIPRNPSDFVGDGSKVLYRDGEISRDGDGNPLTDEGLIYCGTCHQLKQYRIYAPFLGRVLEPYVVCQCEEKIDAQEQQRIIEYNRQRQIKLNLSQADALMLKNTFSVDKYPNSEPSKMLRDYCRHWKDKYQPMNRGLYIFGDVGVGKSFYASCVANEIARVYGDTVKAVSVTRVVNDLFSTDNKSGYIDSLASVDLLVLDDFGAERKSDYGLEQVFSVIDERYKAQKPLILTSNYDYSLLRQKVSVNQKRIYDRVIGMCLPVKIEGASLRGITI